MMFIAIAWVCAAMAVLFVLARLISFALIAKFLFEAPQEPVATAIPRHTHQRFYIPVEDRRLATQVVQPDNPNPRAPLVLICHGQGEVLDMWTAAQDFLADRGLPSLVFDYTGFGESSPGNRPDTLVRDVEGVIKQIDRLFPACPPILLLGFSLGAAALLETLVHRAPDQSRTWQIILCEPFRSIRAMAVTMKMIPASLAGLVPDLFNNAKHIGLVAHELHIVHSQSDETAPLEHGRDLYNQAAADGSQLHVLDGYEHNAIWRDPAGGYWDYILKHVVQVQPARQAAAGAAS